MGALVVGDKGGKLCFNQLSTSILIDKQLSYLDSLLASWSSAEERLMSPIGKIRHLCHKLTVLLIADLMTID